MSSAREARRGQASAASTRFPTRISGTPNSRALRRSGAPDVSLVGAVAIAPPDRLLNPAFRFDHTGECGRNNRSRRAVLGGSSRDTAESQTANAAIGMSEAGYLTSIVAIEGEIEVVDEEAMKELV